MTGLFLHATRGLFFSLTLIGFLYFNSIQYIAGDRTEALEHATMATIISEAGCISGVVAVILIFIRHFSTSPGCLIVVEVRR